MGNIWSSGAIPSWTLARSGATTPNGTPAVFRSNTHAWIALRLVYLAEVVGQAPDQIAEREALYRQHWDRYQRYLAEMRAVVASLDDDLSAAAQRWNSVDQTAADDAATSMMCERESFPRDNLATVAQRHFGLIPSNPDSQDRDRKSDGRDNQAAWLAAPDGRCQSCGSATISQTHHDELRSVMSAHPDLFDLTPTYVQTSGARAPLWSARLLLAAKGAADHIEAWSRGGRTSPDNLANLCAACNYSRNASSLNEVRVAAYR